MAAAGRINVQAPSLTPQGALQMMQIRLDIAGSALEKLCQFRHREGSSAQPLDQFLTEHGLLR